MPTALRSASGWDQLTAGFAERAGGSVCKNPRGGLRAAGLRAENLSLATR